MGVPCGEITMMEERMATTENTYFRLSSCRTMPAMKKCLDYVLRTRQKPGDNPPAWETYNFPALTADEIISTWGQILRNYAKMNVGKPGRPIKKVGYQLVVSPKIKDDQYDNFRNCVNEFVQDALEDTFSVKVFHLGDTNWLHAHLLIHAITPDLKAFRLKPADLVSFRNTWYSTCARFNIPSPMTAPTLEEPTRKRPLRECDTNAIYGLETSAIPFEEEELFDEEHRSGVRQKNADHRKRGS